MIDFSSKGIRCRAAREIRSHEGIVRPFTEGTIQCELENLGRHMISVLWDTGTSMTVFSNEIEIIEDDLIFH